MNGVIRPVLNFLFFFYDKISQALKSNNKFKIFQLKKSILNFLFYFFTIRFHKHQKALKSTKKHQRH